MACDVATWRDELDGLIVQYGLMCAFGSSGDMMKAKAEIDRQINALDSEGVSHGNPLAVLRALIADDAYAMTFQSMGQYRTALLKAADKIAADGVLDRCLIADAKTGQSNQAPVKQTPADSVMEGDK